MADDTTPAQAPIVVPPTPSQLPVPTDTTLSGDNWARNLALFGGQLAQANNARFGAGFLQNPGISSLPIAIGNTFGAASAMDSQAANTQNTLAEAESRRINNSNAQIGLEQYKRIANSTANGGPLQLPNNSLDDDGNVIASNNNNSSTTTPLPKASASGDVIVPQDRLLAMSTQATKSPTAGIPSSVAPILANYVATGLIPTESSSNANPNLVNPTAKDPKNAAFGLTGLLPSTVRNPGYGMKGQDPDALRSDPQGQINFSMEYLYKRATAPIDKGGLGMTDADFSNPGMMAHVAAMYGGASTPQAQQDYVGKTVDNMLVNSGRQKMTARDTPENMMTTALQRNGGAVRPGVVATAAPSNTSQQQTQAEVAQAQKQVDPATAEAQAQVQQSQTPQTTQKPYQEASLTPTSPPSGQAPADSTPAPGYDAQGNALPAGSWDASPVKSAPTDAPQTGATATPATTTIPAPKPSQTSQAAPIATTGTTPLPAPTANPVAQPGSRAEQQQNMAMPAEMQSTIHTLTTQARQNFELAQQYQLAARGPNAASMQALAAQYQQRGQQAQDAAIKLKSDYLQERAKIGTWADGSRNGMAGQVNQTTNEFKPYSTGAGRPFQGANKEWYVAMPGGEIRKATDADLPGIAAASGAEAQGAKTGTAAAATQETMKATARASADNIANIDNGLQAFQKASQNGITPGLLAPYRLDAAKFLKSAIGVNLFGPEAVSEATIGEKSATIVSAALLGRMVANGTLTDAKLAHMAPALPDLHTDPDAIQHLLEYARMQDVYDNKMANDALQHTDPKTGMISPGWEANYLATNGSGPIYDQSTGKTRLPRQVPDGKGGMRIESPADNPIPQINAPTNATGTTTPVTTTQSYPAPSATALSALKANPDKATEFDAKFGPGASAKILGNK